MNDDRHESASIASYRSAVSRDHTRPLQRTKRKRIGNEIDLNDINVDLVYVSNTRRSRSNMSIYS
jgi:phosphohistidine phosphatase SixA